MANKNSKQLNKTEKKQDKLEKVDIKTCDLNTKELSDETKQKEVPPIIENKSIRETNRPLFFENFDMENIENIPIIDMDQFIKIIYFWFNSLNIHNDIIQILYKYYFDYHGILLIYHYSNEIKKYYSSQKDGLLLIIHSNNNVYKINKFLNGNMMFNKDVDVALEYDKEITDLIKDDK